MLKEDTLCIIANLFDSNRELSAKVAALEAEVEKDTSTNKQMVAEAAQISPCAHDWIQVCTQAMCRKCGVITDD